MTLMVAVISMQIDNRLPNVMVFSGALFWAYYPHQLTRAITPPWYTLILDIQDAWGFDPLKDSISELSSIYFLTAMPPKEQRRPLILSEFRSVGFGSWSSENITTHLFRHGGLHETCTKPVFSNGSVDFERLWMGTSLVVTNLDQHIFLGWCSVENHISTEDCGILRSVDDC